MSPNPQGSSLPVGLRGWCGASGRNILFTVGKVEAFQLHLSGLEWPRGNMVTQQPRDSQPTTAPAPTRLKGGLIPRVYFLSVDYHPDTSHIRAPVTCPYSRVCGSAPLAEAMVAHLPCCLVVWHMPEPVFPSSLHISEESVASGTL